MFLIHRRHRTQRPRIEPGLPDLKDCVILLRPHRSLSHYCPIGLLLFWLLLFLQKSDKDLLLPAAGRRRPQRVRCRQCDQIRRFLEFLGNKFYYKRTPNVL